MKDTELNNNEENEEYKKEQLELLNQIFSNCDGMKVLYREGSLRCIIWIDNIEITDKQFSGKAKLLTLIDEFNQKDESKVLREWNFSSILDNLNVGHSGIKANYLWQIWTDEKFVSEIEQLILEKNFKDLYYKMAVFNYS